MKKTILLLCILMASAHTFANLTQGHWRWRNNDGTEKTATWKAAQDSTIKITDNKAIRLRAEVYNNTGSTKTLSRSLQYATSVNGPWVNVTNNSAINAFNYGGDNSYIANNDSTTQQIADPAYPFLPGNIVTSQYPLYTDSIPNNTRREYEWCIKPTENIQRNLTYYFKSSAGGDQALLPFLTATGSAFAAAPIPILPNGGFENNLTNWTTSTGNGAATFNIITAANYVHGGAKALAVTVSNNGSTNAVTLSSGPIALSDTGTYMLRFWAIAKTRNSLLDINLQGAAISNTCHYQIYNRFDTTKNGWQMYQYAFKVSESPVTLQMSFNSSDTYYLDDVEIINETTNPNIDVKNQYNWQYNFAESYGWLSGDNNNPVVLPDKRIAWVYNDSFMGINTPHSNILNWNGIINNLLVVQNKDQLSSVYGGTAPNSHSLFIPGDGNIFWHAGGVVENNQLNVLLIEINNGNYAGHSWVGTLSLPDLSVTGLTRLPLTGTTSPNCILQDGAYDYIYFGESSSQFEEHTKVARVPAGQLNSQTPWQFYESDGTWGSSFSNAQIVVQGVDAGNVVKLDSGNYVMSGIPNLSSELDVWFAKSPVGPWVNQTTIYNIPLEEGILPYEGHLVSQPDSTGQYTLSYSVYPFVTEANGSSGSVAMQIADKTTYVPCYARADLKKLSPFTITKPIDTLVSLTAKDTNNQVLLNWVSAQTTDDYYNVQRSTDGENWQVIGTVQGSDSTSLAHYSYLDTNPATGINYYRIVLYDLDDKQNFSNIVTVNTYHLANLANFTAVADGSSVKIDWSTSSELNNTLFTVQKSADSKAWSTLTTVAGSGTTNTTRNYKVYDSYPFNGINYYRLQYLYNNVDTTSVVRSVDMLQNIVFNIYPNPTSGNVQFQLRGFEPNNFNVELVNAEGRVIDKESFTTNASEIYSLKTKPATGVYILTITGYGLKKSAKVLVE